MRTLYLLIFSIGCIQMGLSNYDLASASKDSLNILFIGNSLTYTNNLPQLVEQECQRRNMVISSEMVALPNYALLDHWRDGQIQKMIRKGKFDYVFIQQGPSSQAWGREVLLEYGKKIRKLCDKHDSELIYLMVWASRTYYHTFDGVIKNHEDAARINGALVCPVGKVWKSHFDATEDFSYYGADGFHPSMEGSLKAAELIVDCLGEL
ncbi:MAG: SGNH/GDSL hydrolase family protein [Saprospiraceae bacterium]|nr:SGNH/GDSL hydrolase family protein [Saprospiraceae bacterium]